MTKEYFGWRGVIKLAKELGYSWQEACEVLYRKKNLLSLKRSVLGLILVDMCIGVILMNRLTEVNLEVRRVGEKRKNFQFIIEEI